MTRLLVFGLLALLLSSVSLVFADNNGDAEVLGLTPPMGWNTWCTLGKCGRDYCDSKEVKGVADAMVENGMKDLGWKYINLDDCWADHRDNQGEIVPDSSRFPEGMKPMIAELNTKGFKFGLYTDGGEYTCSKGERSHSIPGSYGHYDQDAKTYSSWGVEYVKMDWCNSKINGTSLDPHVAYRSMSKALRSTTGAPIFFGACEWGVDNPWEWMKGIANSWRTGSDHHDNWESTAAIIEHNAELGKYAGPGGWNDPDFLMTGGQGCDPPVDMVHCPGQTDTEYRTEFSLWCIMAAPLLVATDVRNMTDVMKKILLNKEMIAVNQDKLGKAGGRLGYGYNCSESHTACQVWGRYLYDGSVAIALYNSGSYLNTINFDFSTLGPDWADTVYVRDLWAHDDLGVYHHSITSHVESHGVEVYKVSKVKR